MISETLVVSEEERLVLHDRAAEPSAELILFQRLRLACEVVRRIERIVPQELPQRAVQLVRAGTRDDVGGRSQSVSELGIRVVGQDLELDDGINRRLENEASVHPVEVIRTIDQETVGLRPLTVDRIGLAGAQRASGLRETRREWYNSRLQQAQLREVSSIQR